MSDALGNAITVVGTLVLFVGVAIWAYVRLRHSDLSIFLYRTARASMNAANWSFRHKWTSFAWWFGLTAFCGAAVCAGTVAASQGLLAAVGLQLASWPLGAALGGLIDAVLRSRRSRSREVAVR